MAMVLDVRLDGFDRAVGHLTSDTYGAIAFAYTEDYLELENAMAISLSMPLDSAPYGDVASRAYFDNLLPERDTARADIIARYGLGNDDVAGILFHLGRDCPGAISVLPEGSPAVKLPGNLNEDYDRLTHHQLVEIVQSLYERRPLPGSAQDPSPLAGVQSKIALTLLPDGTFAAPRAGTGAPTTHIIKVPDYRHLRDPDSEHSAMELSRSAGFATADTETRTIGDIPVLVVTRFDRVRDAEGLIRRRHQEDYCQALGLSSRQKYERRGTQERRFNADAIGRLLDRSIDPIHEKRQFIEITLFDLMIGNVDGHAKNFSLFHHPGNRVESTPRYDVMPTMLDRDTTDEFAYSIGSAKDLTELTPANLDTFLSALGLSSAAGRRRLLNQILPATAAHLDAKLGDLQASGLKNFADLIGTNIRTMFRRLELDPPPRAAERDAFVR